MSTYSGAEGSSLNFGELVKSSDIYQLDETVYDEGCDVSTEVPFVLLSGETPINIGLCCKEHLLVLTNYRLFASVKGGYYSRPLGLIESVTYPSNQPLEVVLTCRDSCTVKLTLDSVAQCKLWVSRIQIAIKPAMNFRDTFAFIHFAYSVDTQPRSPYLTGEYDKSTRITAEFKRLGMDRTGQWRITEINAQYKLCSTYPKLMIVPRSISDTELGEVAKYRSGERIPAIVWRHRGNGSVIARSSQPLVGVLGWRCQEDEKLVAAISTSCLNSSSSVIKAPAMESMHCEETKLEPKPPTLLVMDLRSYAAVLGNRAKGGGCECVEYYPNCEVVCKGLPNIHAVRTSFQLLRTLVSNREKPGFLAGLEHTNWLLNVNQLLIVAGEAVTAIEDGRPVLVHCTDGWDRTTQVVALAQLMLDPYYRTIEGFQRLVEKDWISFGHKFADRSGCNHADASEQSPVFLQWLDAVHQLVKQFPTIFQFNIGLLVKLALHCYSMLYGTFLCNCEREREDERIERQTISVWHFIYHNKKEFLNVFYEHSNQMVLHPKFKLHSIFFWRELFMSTSLIPYASTQHVPVTDISSKQNDDYLPVNRTDSKLVSQHQNGSARHDDPHSPSSSNGILNQSLDNGGIPDILPSSMEDSFRIVVEDELSLTRFTVPQVIENSHSLHRKHSLVSSFSSDCDSRLRLLGDDGLARCNDPVQRRVFEMKEALQLQVDDLQEKLDRLNCALRTKRESEEASSPSVIASPEGVKEEDELQFSCSPANGWMCVNASDSRGVQWAPDHSVLHCQMCGENFWLGRRRHHCRSCGDIFCWKCSNYFCPVPQEQLFGQQRVCIKCFDKLDGFLETPETSS